MSHIIHTVAATALIQMPEENHEEETIALIHYATHRHKDCAQKYDIQAFIKACKNDDKCFTLE